MSKIKGKGQNPNSHNNKPKLGLEVGSVKLTPEQWNILEKLGKGNKSLGVRSLLQSAISLNAENLDCLFAKLPALGRAKIAIEMLLDGHEQAQEYAESVLYDLENLEIENLYEKSVIDGAVKTSKNVYIV